MYRISRQCFIFPFESRVDCRPLSEAIGRCGPAYGGRCNKRLADDAVYCNTETESCGTSDDHKNAQAGDEYDWEPRLCKGNANI